MYVFGKDDVSKMFIDRIESSLLSSQQPQTDEGQCEGLSGISKAFLPDYVLIYKEYGRFLQTKYECNEITLQNEDGEENNIDPDNMSYHDIIRLAQVYKETPTSKALEEYIGLVNDTLGAGLELPIKDENDETRK